MCIKVLPVYIVCAYYPQRTKYVESSQTGVTDSMWALLSPGNRTLVLHKCTNPLHHWVISLVLNLDFVYLQLFFFSVSMLVKQYKFHTI